MKRVMALVMGLMILFGAVMACSLSTTSAHATTYITQTASRYVSQTATSDVSRTATSDVSRTATSDVSQTAPPPPASCASAGTRKIPKTRLLADLGLAYGAFHRYLYNPYKAGSFSKGASGRTKAIVKAGLATAAIVKLLSNASKNAAADPTLCKFVPNIDNIKTSLSGMGGKVKGGTATSSDFNSTSGMFDHLKSGTGFTPPSNSSLPGLG
jgi:hypothetical protein